MIIAICDDEKVYREYTKRICNKYFEEKSLDYDILEFTSSEELLAYSKELHIILLDIKMKGIDGICAKNILSENKSNAKIIFMTSHAEEMENAFGKNVYGFLIKPFEFKSLVILMDKILDDIDRELLIEILYNGEKRFIKGENILYIKAEDKYSILRTKEYSYLVRKSMNEWENLLSGYDFYRVHRSNIVNLSHIKSFDKFITMDNNIKIKLSKRNTKSFKDEYYDYLKRRAK